MNTQPHRWTLVGDVLVSFSLPGVIPDKVWDDFVKDLGRQRIVGCLVLCIGAVDVNSIQRKTAGDAVLQRKLPVVVVTDDRVVRGLVTAVGWLGVQIDSFSWSQLDGAVNKLRVSPATSSRCVEEALRFKAANMAAA